MKPMTKILLFILAAGMLQWHMPAAFAQSSPQPLGLSLSVSEPNDNEVFDEDKEDGGYEEESPEEPLTLGASEEEMPEEPPVEKEELPGESAPTLGESSLPVFSADLVSYTTSVSGLIDPYNLSGNGQINYDNIQIVNGNEMPVRIVLTRVDFSTNSGAYLATQRPAEESTDKWIMFNVNLDEKRNDGPYFRNGTNEMDLGVIGPGETVTAAIGGVAATNACDWKAEDVIHVSLFFTFAPVEINPS